MKRYLFFGALIAIFLFTALQCSSGGDPSTPPVNPGEAMQTVQMNSGSDVLLGLWEFAFDVENNSVEITRLRQGDLAINVLKFLEKVPYTNLTVDYTTFELNAEEKRGKFDLIITQAATSPDNRFTIFDLRGVFFGPDVRNADGWTAMMNPADFTGVPFGYTNGLLGTPHSVANYTSDWFGYKYFGDGIGQDDDYTTFFSDEANLLNRGMFSEGAQRRRHYELYWSIPGYKNYPVFNYALVASYDFPDGDAPYDLDNWTLETGNVAESFCGEITVTKNDIYLDNGELNGTLDLDVEVWDWQGLGSTEVEIISDILAPSSAVSTYDAGTTSKSGIFHFEDLEAQGDVDPGFYDIWAVVTDNSETFGSSWFMDFLPLDNPRYNDPVFTTYRLRLEIDDNTAPTALAELYPELGAVGQMITLDASSSFDNESDNADLIFEWDLDIDGQYDDAFGEVVETSYDTEGIYEVDLKVTDPGGLSDTLDELLQVEITLCGDADAHADNGSQFNFTSGYSVLPNSDYRHDIAFLTEGPYAGRAVVQAGPYSLGTFDADTPGDKSVDALCKLRPFYYYASTGPEYISNVALEIEVCPVGGYILVVSDSLDYIEGEDFAYHTDKIDAYAPDGSGIVFSARVLQQTFSIIAIDCDDNGDIWLIAKKDTDRYLFKLPYVGGDDLWEVDFSIQNALDLSDYMGILDKIIDISVDYIDNRLYIFYYELDYTGELMAIDISTGSPVYTGTDDVSDVFSGPINVYDWTHPMTPITSYGHKLFAGIEIDHEEADMERCRIVCYARLVGESKTPEVVRLNALGEILDRNTGTVSPTEFAINNDAEIRDLIFCEADEKGYLWDAPDSW
jgi:hypothetical protein